MTILEEPEIRSIDSWLKILGFEGKPGANARFYNAHDLPSSMKLVNLFSSWNQVFTIWLFSPFL